MAWMVSETDKHFLMSLLYATGIILFWRGVWEISYEIPILSNVYVSFFVGLLILTLTGVIYKEFDLFGQRHSKIFTMLNEIAGAARKEGGYVVHYFDSISKKHHKIHSHDIRRVEHQHLVLEKNGREVFIPLHRVSRIHKGKKVVWVK